MAAHSQERVHSSTSIYGQMILVLLQKVYKSGAKRYLHKPSAPFNTVSFKTEKVYKLAG